LLLGGALAGDGLVAVLSYVVDVKSAAGAAVINFLYLAIIPVGVAGILDLAARRDRSSTLRRSLDAVLIGLSLLVISWSVVLRPLYAGSHATGINRVFDLVFPVGDVIILSLVVFVATRYRSEGTTGLTFIGLAMVIWSFSDSAYSYLAFRGTYYQGHPVEVGWFAGYALLLVAAGRARPTTREESPPTLPRIHVPYFIAGASLAVGVGMQAVRMTLDPVVVYGLLVLCVLVIVRQFVAILEAKSLTISRMRELDQLKSSFLMAISHDLRTPLTSVVGYASLLDDGVSDLSAEEVAEFAHTINVSGQRLERLLADLLDVERLSRGILEARRRVTDMRELVRRVLEYSGKDGRVRIEIAKGTHADVDPALVERIVENLVSNGVKYTPPGTTICVRGEPQGEDFLLTVEDNGPGVPDELKTLIFDLFQQNGPAYQPGTGVGLSLVAQFAKLHGGRAWVEDTPGGGARFRVLLCAAAVRPTEEADDGNDRVPVATTTT
jgi:signal transduction histidine kinase/uncharacterized membrane protein